MKTIIDKRLSQQIAELVGVEKAVLIRVNLVKGEIWVFEEPTNEEKERVAKLVQEMKESVKGQSDEKNNKKN